MHNKLIGRISAFLIGVIILLGLVYLGLVCFYARTFMLGTSINGIYCTGRTVSQADELLRENYDYSGLEVADSDGITLFTIEPDEVDMTVDFESDLKKCMASQDPRRWPEYLVKINSIELKPVVTFDEEKAAALVHSQIQELYDSDRSVSVKMADGVYSLHDGTKNIPDTESISSSVLKALLSSADEIILDDSYFSDSDYTPEEQAQVNSYDLIKKTCCAGITYILGDDREVVDEAVVTSFLKKDDDGNPVLLSGGTEDNEDIWDREAIEAWVDDLADRYDSVGKTREFIATGGKKVTVEGGIYGNKIDRSAEKEYLISAVANGTVEAHEPEYIQKARCQGINDIGDTYIEINMTDQKLYYYVDGEQVLETDVVTGNTGSHMGTPTGTNYVYYKQRGRTLVGATYRTYVNYWMAVKGHIGIHDATWRSEFGGDIYKTSGSHGCVNTPMEAVGRLYDMVEIGTPVVMYYTDT